MAEYGKSAESKAPAERVWGIWRDPSSWHEWNPNVSSMEMESPLRPGSEGVMHTRAGRHHRMRVLDVQEGRSFTLATSVIPGSTFHFHCRVEPLATGSRVSQAVEIVGPMGWLYGPLMGNQVAKDFDPLLQALARRAEGSSEAGGA